MNKVYYLKTCSTCSRILKELDLPSDFVLQDIKSEPITKAQLEQMGEYAGSYDALFSKRATLYKTLDLKNQSLTEKDYKQYILDQYTFLSRPVFIINSKIYIGNSKKILKPLNTL